MRSIALHVTICALLAAGCNSSPPDATSTTADASPALVVGQDIEPIGSPPMKEGIGRARRRIDAAVSSGDCDRIDELAPRSVADSVAMSGDFCSSVKTYARGEVLEAAAYGGLAGVIDYASGDQVATAVMVRDADGLFHIAFVSGGDSRTVGTPPSGRESDDVADAAISALSTRDCAAFLEVATPDAGIGSLDEQGACSSTEAVQVAAATFGGRPARLVRLGGNGRYVFYSLKSRDAHLTIVVGEAEDSPPRYVASYVTNRRELTSEP